MKISDVKISFLQHKQDGLFAIASFTINDKFLISGVGIHEIRDGDGYRLTYPTKKSGNRVFNICHPINRQLSKSIESAIFNALKTVIEKRCNRDGQKQAKK